MKADFFDRGSEVGGIRREYDPFGVEGQPDEPMIDLRRVLAALWRDKLFLILFVLLGLAYGVFAAVQREPIYDSSATIIFEFNRLQPLDPLDVVADPERQTSLENEIEILGSTALLDRVVSRLGMAEIDPEEPAEDAAPQEEVAPQEEDASELGAEPGFLDGVVSAINTSFVEFQSWIGDNLVGGAPVSEGESEPVDPEAARAELQLAASRRARSRLRDALEFRQVGGSRVIEITFESTDPQEAARIANTIGEEYIMFQEQLRNEEADSIIAIMNSRIEDLKDRLAASEERLEAARLSQSQRQGQSADMLNTQLNALNGELAEIRLQLAAAEARHDRADAVLKSGADLWSVSEFRDSEVITQLRSRLLEVREGIVQEAARAGTSRTPSRAITDALIVEVERSVREEASFIVASLGFAEESLREREKQLRGIIVDLERIVIEQSTDEARIERLNREVSVNQTIYESFVDRLREISEQANFQAADARFLSRAEPAGVPNLTDNFRVLMVSGIVGLIFGLVLLLARSELNRSIRGPDELKTLTGLSVLGAIPMYGRRKRSSKRVVATFLKKPTGALSESIRNLRTSVLYANPQSQPKVVMLTSSEPGEGKSLVSLLIGLASQQTGRKTVLIGCDLREKSNHKLYQSFPRLQEREDKETPGLISYLRGGFELDDIINTETNTNLHLISATTKENLKESPADLLSSQAFVKLIGELKQKYDLVILDTPPALAVADSRLLARLADSIVFLVRWNKTNKNAVREGLHALTSMKANVVGCVFTMVAQSRARKYTDNEFFYKKSYDAYYN